MSEFGKEIENALNNTDDVPEGFEKCEDCGGLHPKAEFPKYEGPILFSQTEIESGKAGFTMDDLHNLSKEAWDICDPDKLQPLATLHKMFGSHYGLNKPDLSYHLMMDAMGQALTYQVLDWRRENPNCTAEELVHAIRGFATKAHYVFQTLGEELARMMTRNPPRSHS